MIDDADCKYKFDNEEVMVTRQLVKPSKEASLDLETMLI